MSGTILADWHSTKMSEMKTRTPARLFSRSLRLRAFPPPSSLPRPALGVITTSDGGRGVRGLLVVIVATPVGLDERVGEVTPESNVVIHEFSFPIFSSMYTLGRQLVEEVMKNVF